MRVQFQLNGKAVKAEIESHELLLDYLRDVQGITSVKRSCEVQVCGACTVLVDGAPVSSCCCLAYEAREREVTTIEGLIDRPEFTAIEDAFTRQAAVQCGFCVPGMVLTIYALRAGREQLTEAEIRVGLSGNFCRCTGYRSILDAVHELSVPGTR